MYKVYQVEIGDTMDSIASKVNANRKEIEELNGLLSNYELTPGDYLVVPNKTKDGFASYFIKKDDTIYEIAQKYNVDYMQLLKLNGLNKYDYIYPNEEIKVPIGNTKFYITEENDTVDKVIKYLGGDPIKILNENEMKLKSDQLIYVNDN